MFVKLSDIIIIPEKDKCLYENYFVDIKGNLFLRKSFGIFQSQKLVDNYYYINDMVIDIRKLKKYDWW